MRFRAYINKKTDPLELLFGKGYKKTKIKIKGVQPTEITADIPKNLEENKVDKYISINTIEHVKDDENTHSFEIDSYKIAAIHENHTFNIFVGVRHEKKKDRYGVFVTGDIYKNKLERTPLLKENQLFSEVELKLPTDYCIEQGIQELFTKNKIHKIIDFYKKHAEELR